MGIVLFYLHSFILLKYTNADRKLDIFLQDKGNSSAIQEWPSVYLTFSNLKSAKIMKNLLSINFVKINFEYLFY